MGRRLGQHFLTDPRILQGIVDAIDPEADDVVIEVGAGKGSLTRPLAPRVGRVIAIERDAELAGALAGSGIAPNVNVVAGDALELDWHNLVPDVPFKVVGNIPYYITSPLIEKALTPPVPQVIVFLAQREVADRLAATPGTRAYGGLTIGVQVVSGVERLFTVKRGAFRPPPKVDSAVVRLTPLKQPLLPPDRQPPFRRFVTAVFGQRRKQLGRILRSVADLGQEQAVAAVRAVGADPAARPEVLSPQEFVRLYQSLPR